MKVEKFMKIFIVEDDVTLRSELSTMLCSYGYDCEATDDFKNIIAVLLKAKADLILLDMIMDPGINGRETYEKIIKIHPHQKAIIVSGFAETDDVMQTQKLGAGKFIKKPLTLGRLSLAIKEEMER